MRILIAGSGKVGLELASQLSAEGHDITLIDRKSTCLQNAIEKYDVMTVEGNAASLDVLKAADVVNADLLIATTGLDEINMLSCVTARQLNPKIHTIARIRNPEYKDQVYLMKRDFGLSLAVNPEKEAAVEITRLINFPGFLKQDTFVDGRVEIVEIYLHENNALVNRHLYELPEIVQCKVLVCAVLRDGKAIMPSGDFVLEAGDEIFVTASTQNLRQLLKSLGIVAKKAKNVFLAGGSRIAYYLAKELTDEGLTVKIVDRDYERCEELVSLLPKAAVSCGDVSNHDFLEEEYFEQFDTLVTLTGLDELNIVLSIYGRSVGIQQVITKLGRAESMAMLDKLPVGSMICPKELCANSIVRYVRAMQNEIGPAITVHKIAEGQAEAIEFLVDDTTRHCGEPLKNIKTNENVLVCCISRGQNIEIPNGDSTFRKGDHIVIVSNGRTVIRQLNDIFEDK